MAISIKDLPPKYQAQVLQKVIEQDRRKKREITPSLAMSEVRDAASKYHNSPTERMTEGGAVIRFDSRKEARRYDELMALLKAGKIKDLRLQRDFTLLEAYTGIQGYRVRAIRYRADFTYYRPRDGTTSETRDNYSWVLVVEDVKSRATRTKDYLMKKKLMKDRFGIDIVEV